VPTPCCSPSSGTTIRIVDDVNTAKRSLRARIRAERRNRDPRQRQAEAEELAFVVQELPEIRSARYVTVYASMSTEPETAPLRTALRARGIHVLLPIALPGGVLDWAEDCGPLRAVKGRGEEEPAGPRLGGTAIRRADVVLAPALAVDTLGNRLGQGAGYYDRALPLVPPGVPVIAVVNVPEVLDAAVEPVPTEPHDRRVDAVVTPRGYLRLEPYLR
jgi:5-formyltetrahydrofolate cyclo-ligase